MTLKSREIYLHVKKDIINSIYKLGNAISEHEVAERYNVSKTPVREALALLVHEGYLIKYPRRGYFVKTITRKEHNDLLQLRYLLEIGIARHVIARCTAEEIDSLHNYTTHTKVSLEEFDRYNKHFHLALAELTNNKYIVKSLRMVFENIRNSAVEGYTRLKNDMHRDHRRIICALQNRDITAIEALLRQELQRSDEAESVFYS